MILPKLKGNKNDRAFFPPCGAASSRASLAVFPGGNSNGLHPPPEPAPDSDASSDSLLSFTPSSFFFSLDRAVIFFSLSRLTQRNVLQIPPPPPIPP